MVPIIIYEAKAMLIAGAILLTVVRSRSVLALSTAVAALGGLLLGFDTAVIAGTTASLSHVFGLSPTRLGLTVSCAIWGTVLGGYLAGAPGRRFGPREGLRVTAVFYLMSALGCALAGRWSVFLLFRLLSGVAIGGCSVFSPMYLSETAPARLRGRLVACFQLSVVSGILLAYGSNAELASIFDGAHLWRWQLGVAAVPALLFLLLLGKIPQSPSWLERRGRLSEARAVRQRLGANERLQDQSAQPSTPKQPASVPSLLAPAFRKPLLLALLLGSFNQLSGINAVLYYANDIFASAGFSWVSANRQAVAIGTANLIFTLIGMLLIDSVGRKPLLLWGAAAMALTLSGVASVFLTGRFRGSLLPLLVGFIAAFAVSQGAVVWVYMSEIFPGAIREKGQSLASAWLWCLAATISAVFPMIAAHSSGAPFIVFAIAMLLQFLIVLRFFPETKGHSLEEVEQAMRAASLCSEKF